MAAADSASGPEWLWNSGAQADSKPAASASPRELDVLALRRKLEQQAPVSWRRELTAFKSIALAPNL